MERLIKADKILPKNSKDIIDSRFGLGMEKLDRDAFNPEQVYDKVAELGVKWIRLQSGWQKTEKKKGVYDFGWLDEQVDNLIKRGLKPWLCLCYGNVLYDELAKQYYGAVGCAPIRSEEAYNAWEKYVYVTVKHFTDRIEYYEVWNEADGGWTWRPEANAKEYAEFCIRTAKAIRNADSSAKVITGSHYGDTLSFFNEEFAYGSLDVSDAITYHSYNYDERMSIQRIKALDALTKQYGKTVEIIQGESGSQSKTGGNGALSWIRTDEKMQMKQILRHSLADIIEGVKFTSVFSCVDMAENLDAKEGAPITQCGYFGLLGAEFDPKLGTVIGEYKEKPSYYAFQNICSVFDENVQPINIPVIFRQEGSSRIDGEDCRIKDVIYGGLRKENGSCAFVYWNSTDMITVKEYEATTTFDIAGVGGAIRLIDPATGIVYDIPEEILKDNGNGHYEFKNIVIKDYPLIITFGDFIS
ncbi:MAG: beta-galactosidase [Monoglobaceae bacterium]